MIERRNSSTGDLQIIRPPHGQLIEVVRPGAGSAVFHFDPSGRMTEVVVGEQTLIRQAFDQAGQLVEVSAGGGVIHVGRDPLGRPITVADLGDQGGVRQRFDYDERGRLVRRRLGPVDEVSTFDGEGRLSLQVRGTDSARRFEYDRQGKLTRVVDTERGPTEIARDPEGRIVTVGSPGASRSYSYDQHGNVATIDGRPASSFGEPAQRFGSFDHALAFATGDGTQPGRLYIGKAGQEAEILVQKGAHHTWLGVRVQGRPSALWIDGTYYHVLTSPLDAVELLDGDGRVVWSGELDPEGRLLQSEGLPSESVPLAMLLRDSDHGVAFARSGGRPPWDDVGRLDDAIIGF